MVLYSYLSCFVDTFTLNTYVSTPYYRVQQANIVFVFLLLLLTHMGSLAGAQATRKPARANPHTLGSANSARVLVSPL